MNINTSNLASISEANQNFSKVAKQVDENGSVVILRNNKPAYILMPFEQANTMKTMPDEDLLSISKRIIDENRVALEELAK